MDKFSIAVTGGKGGTGKTLIATNLAVALSESGKKVLLVDCDVENPNCNILLNSSLNDPKAIREDISIFNPEFDSSKCIRCGKCSQSCYRHAIMQFIDDLPFLLENMCSGCEVCSKICEYSAITRKEHNIGKKYFIPMAHPNLDLLVGELNPSEAQSVAIVENILTEANLPEFSENYDIVVIDTAPGAHCDVEKAVGEASMILVVTEPTPFGEHDLKRILDLLKLASKKSSIILNRSTLTEYKQPIIDVLEEYSLDLIGEIPIDPLIIENYAQGIPFILDTRSFAGKIAFQKLFLKIQQQIELKEGNYDD